MTPFGPMRQKSVLRLGAPERGAGKTVGFDWGVLVARDKVRPPRRVEVETNHTVKKSAISAMRGKKKTA